MHTDLKLTPWINSDTKKALFWVEISDGKNFFTTSSDSEFWKFGESIEKEVESFYVKRGDRYIIDVIRETNSYTITYMDKNRQPIFKSLKCGDVEFESPKVYIKSFLGNITVTTNNNSESVYGKDEYPSIDSTSTPVELLDKSTVEFIVDIEDGDWFGFFEYECWYKDINVHSRSLDQLQSEMTRTIKEINDGIKNSIKTKDWELKYNELSPREQIDMTRSDYYYSLMERDLTEDEYDSIKDSLYNENIVITESDECEIQYFKPSQSDIQELEDILTKFPNISQIELENIYYHHKTIQPLFLAV